MLSVSEVTLASCRMVIWRPNWVHDCHVRITFSVPAFSSHLLLYTFVFCTFHLWCLLVLLPINPVIVYESKLFHVIQCRYDIWKCIVVYVISHRPDYASSMDLAYALINVWCIIAGPELASLVLQVHSSYRWGLGNNTLY